MYDVSKGNDAAPFNTKLFGNISPNSRFYFPFACFLRSRSVSVSHLGAFTKTTTSNRWCHHQNFPIFHTVEMLLLLCGTLLKLTKFPNVLLDVCMWSCCMFHPRINAYSFMCASECVCVRDPPLRANVVELFSNIATLTVWQKLHDKSEGTRHVGCTIVNKISMRRIVGMLFRIHPLCRASVPRVCSDKSTRKTLVGLLLPLLRVLVALLSLLRVMENKCSCF